MTTKGITKNLNIALKIIFTNVKNQQFELPCTLLNDLWQGFRFNFEVKSKFWDWVGKKCVFKNKYLYDN